MALYNIFFSPTGGTQKAALALAQGIGEDWKTIDLSLPRVDYSQVALTEEDTAILAVPSFGGLVPQPALARLRQLRGMGARAVLLCVYGGRAFEDTLVQLEDAAGQPDSRWLPEQPPWLSIPWSMSWLPAARMRRTWLS